MKAKQIRPITYMKTHSAELVDLVNQTRAPIVITQNGEARAVVVDVKSYEATQDALLLLKILALSEDDIREGRVRPHKQVVAEFWKQHKR